MKTTFLAFAVMLTIAISQDANAKRKVYGTITDKDGNALSGVRVKLLDSDTWSKDDLMGTDRTDANGYYEISYEGKHWDSAPHGITSWRPDVYIKVSRRVNGRCDGSDWNATANWEYLDESREYKNQKLRNDRRINLQLTHFPATNYYFPHTFILCENMDSWVNFPLHTKSKGYDNEGRKHEWGDWTITGVKRMETRCVSTSENSRWTDEDATEMFNRCSDPTDYTVNDDITVAHYLTGETEVNNESSSYFKLKVISIDLTGRKQKAYHYLKPEDKINLDSTTVTISTKLIKQNTYNNKLKNLRLTTEN